MKLSLNYITTNLGVKLPDSLDQITAKIGAQLGAIDDVVSDLNKIYDPVVVVKVVDCQPIDGSDHLNLCLVDDGQVVKGVERQDNGLVQVICGAPNVKKDGVYAWLPPGSIVPSTYYKDPFTLEARSIRGQVSNGMLASPKELAFSDDHDGLLDIDQSSQPGDSFKQLYHLDDQVIDIENKMFTHRPDCFGLVGIARELAGIFNQPYKSPGWYLSDQIDEPQSEQLPLEVNNEIPNLVPRFTAVIISGIKVGPSSLQTQSYLSRLGIRPVNNIVDATNMSMILTGQPLHAYDYYKIKSLSGGQPMMTVRFPRAEESITLLNQKMIKPRQESIMIAAGDQLIGMGGIMGSADSEVDDQTTTIVLEAATFDMYSIRRSSMELGIFSDAVTRFSKGQSPLQPRKVLASCTKLITEASPGSAVASKVIDINKLSEAVNERGSLYPEINLPTDFINKRLGSQLSADDMVRLLTNVEIEAEITDQDQIKVKAPFWRTDLEIREDIVEEVGRLYGYDNLKPSPLSRLFESVPRNEDLEVKSRIRQILARAGANELLTYSFISKNLLTNAAQDSDSAYEIANSLSPELEFYRPSLTPSMLAKVHMNIKAGFDQFAIYEIGKYHLINQLDDKEPDQPKEFESLSLVYTSKKPGEGAAYYHARNYLSFVLEEFKLGSSYSFVAASQAELSSQFVQMVKPYNEKRSALVVSQDNQVVGIVGEFKSEVSQRFKLPNYCAGFEVSLDLFKALTKEPPYRRLSKYPSVKQDITLKVPAGVAYAELYNCLITKLDELKGQSRYFNFDLLSIFKPEASRDDKHLSFRLVITDYDRTLSDQVVNKLLDNLAAEAHKQFQASRV